MPQQSSEPTQPVESDRKGDESKDKNRPDVWCAGQQEDLSAGDEGVDDPTLEDFRDDLNEAREGDTEQDEIISDDVELPAKAR